MQKEILVQYSSPTRYLTAETGTICKVIKNDHTEEYYIQTSEEGEAHWLSMGIFLEKSFEEFFSNEQFIRECLRLYSYNTNRPFNNIGRIIQQKNTA